VQAQPQQQAARAPHQQASTEQVQVTLATAPQQGPADVDQDDDDDLSQLPGDLELAVNVLVQEFQTGLAPEHKHLPPLVISTQVCQSALGSAQLIHLVVQPGIGFVVC
jgi:hypothetical protein